MSDKPKIGPWQSIVSVPQNDWFCEIDAAVPYYYKITAIRLPYTDPISHSKSPLQVQFSYGSWWNVEDLLWKFLHVRDVGDTPRPCGNEV